MTLRLAILASLVAAGMIFGLYKVEHAVRQLDRELVELDTTLSREREAIRVLNAEWSYLTQPSRLQDLVSRYSDLRLVEPDQEVTAAALFAVTDGARGETEAEQTAAPLPLQKPVIGDTRVTFVRGEDSNVQ